MQPSNASTRGCLPRERSRRETPAPPARRRPGRPAAEAAPAEAAVDREEAAVRVPALCVCPKLAGSWREGADFHFGHSEPEASFGLWDSMPSLRNVKL